MVDQDTGESILSKIKEAIPERNEHREDLHEFKASLAGQYRVQLAQWKNDVEAWEADLSRPNPFEVKSDGECLMPFEIVSC